MNKIYLLAWIWPAGPNCQSLIYFNLTTTRDRIFFNHSPTDRHLSCFQFFTLMIDAAVNISTCATVSLEKTLRTVTAESQCVHVLHFNRCCQMASKVAVPINAPTNSVCMSGLPTLLPMLNSTSIFGIWILCEALMR